MAVLIYPHGISGKTANEIVNGSERITYAIGIGNKKMRYWRLRDDWQERRDADKKMRRYSRGILLENPGDDIGILYGAMVPVGNLKTFQRIKGMSLAANKPRFRLWAQKNNISVPLTWLKGNEPDNMPDDILWRPSNHSKGINYHMFKGDTYDACDRVGGYFSALLPKSTEYRIYTFGGYVWCVSQKIPIGDVGPLDPWNYSTGKAIFKILANVEWRRNTCKLAMTVSHALNLWWAGVDVIISNDKPYIVEVNNAPGMIGALKPRNFGFLIDNLIERIINEEEISIVDPKTVKQVRHPLLKNIA